VAEQLEQWRFAYRLFFDQPAPDWRDELWAVHHDIHELVCFKREAGRARRVCEQIGVGLPELAIYVIESLGDAPRVIDDLITGLSLEMTPEEGRELYDQLDEDLQRQMVAALMEYEVNLCAVDGLTSQIRGYLAVLPPAMIDRDQLLEWRSWLEQSGGSWVRAILAALPIDDQPLITQLLRQVEELLPTVEKGPGIGLDGEPDPDALDALDEVFAPHSDDDETEDDV